MPGQMDELRGGDEFIKNYLTAYAVSTGKDWDLWCREAAFAYNSSVHSSTCFTPAKLMFGRDYLVPLDILYAVSRAISDHLMVDEYIKRLQGLYEIVHSNMSAGCSLKLLRKVASYYDRKVLDNEVEID